MVERAEVTIELRADGKGRGREGTAGSWPRLCLVASALLLWMVVAKGDAQEAPTLSNSQVSMELAGGPAERAKGPAGSSDAVGDQSTATGPQDRAIEPSMEQARRALAKGLAERAQEQLEHESDATGAQNALADETMEQARRALARGLAERAQDHLESDPLPTGSLNFPIAGSSRFLRRDPARGIVSGAMRGPAFERLFDPRPLGAPRTLDDAPRDHAGLRAPGLPGAAPPRAFTPPLAAPLVATSDGNDAGPPAPSSPVPAPVRPTAALPDSEEPAPARAPEPEAPHAQSPATAGLPTPDAAPAVKPLDAFPPSPPRATAALPDSQEPAPARAPEPEAPRAQTPATAAVPDSTNLKPVERPSRGPGAQAREPAAPPARITRHEEPSLKAEPQASGRERAGRPASRRTRTRESPAVTSPREQISAEPPHTVRAQTRRDRAPRATHRAHATMRPQRPAAEDSHIPVIPLPQALRPTRPPAGSPL